MTTKETGPKNADALLGFLEFGEVGCGFTGFEQGFT